MAGIDGFGTKLRRGDGATPQTFTDIAELTSIGAPTLARDTYEVTTHGSPEQWREFIGGLKDGGDVSGDVNYMPSAHDFLVADFDDKEPRDYQIVFPDLEQTTWTFKAILNKFEPSAPFDDKLTASLGWKVSGKPTLS
ncbi:phage tail tube protein [Kitasatospora sp. NPDC059463]|uniref:phage tail tube protein n=1 Tax=unclassified Kitasatospora TaxID=2633591 RepID=UPI00367413AF